MATKAELEAELADLKQEMRQHSAESRKDDPAQGTSKSEPAWEDASMCRLYALKANEPTRVKCSLVHAQNAQMAQSAGDSEGLVHGHGWGVADYANGVPLIEKQTWAAFQGVHFARKAARVYARTVVAHVRRATVGIQSIENTHPFQYRAVEIASEPLSDENWLEFPEDVVYSVDEDFYLLTRYIPQ